MKTDEELAYLCKKGEDDAIEELFNRYKSLNAKIARGYFLLGADEEDLLQEANIGLYKAIINYNPKNNVSFKTFATLCVKRNIISAIKKSNSKKNKILNESVSLSSFNSKDDKDEEFLYLPSNFTFDNLIEKEKYEDIKKQIVNRLSNLELKILNQYLKGYSYDVMAKNLHITKKSVDNALSRIKKKLQFLI